MQLSSLTAISPLDGRYFEQLSELSNYFSEYALIKARVIVECRWLQALAMNNEIAELAAFDSAANKQINQIIDQFSQADAEQIKHIEKTTQHDVKAVEYFLAKKIPHARAFIHFACTSEDINNLSYALLLKQAREFLLNLLQPLIGALTQLAHDYADSPMLSRTHGQAASPTTFGKEMANSIARLQRQIRQLTHIQIMGKINGAVGNFNAHHLAYPNVNWPEFAKNFIEQDLGLHYQAYSTQIEPHDMIAEMGHVIIRLNQIAVDLCRDIWGYISLDYLGLKVVASEVGSSTMPHKVNPIQFENAEGNFGMSTALWQHLATALTTSRWQRDLTDSTLLRNLGVAMGHAVLGFKSLTKGLTRIKPNTQIMLADLSDHWSVLAEAAQTVMRQHGITDAYEQLKAVSRGQPLDAKRYLAFIEQVNLPDAVKQSLATLTPEQYTGLAAKLARDIHT